MSWEEEGEEACIDERPELPLDLLSPKTALPLELECRPPWRPPARPLPPEPYAPLFEFWCESAKSFKLQKRHKRGFYFGFSLAMFLSTEEADNKNVINLLCITLYPYNFPEIKWFSSLHGRVGFHRQASLERLPYSLGLQIGRGDNQEEHRTKEMQECQLVQVAIWP